MVSPHSAVWAREIYEADWSPAYGVWHGAPVVQFSAKTETPCERAIAVASGRTSQRDTRALELLLDGRGQDLSVYRYSEGDTALTLCFHDTAGGWSFGPIRSDARLFAWERTATSSRLLAASASFLEVDGGRVFKDSAPVERFEWSAAAGVDSSSASATRSARVEPLDALDATLAQPAG